MRVALSFPGCHRRGGVERVVLEAANYLAARGHDTHLIANEWDDRYLRTEVHRHAVSWRHKLPLSRLLLFPRLAARELQRLGPRADSYGAFGVQCPLGGVVWVQSVHRAWLEISRTQRKLPGRLRQRLNPFHLVVSILERRYYGRRNYRKLIALTEDVKADLHKYYHVPLGDVEVLPNGYSPDEFSVESAQASREQVRTQLGYRSNDKVVVFVANELERKGFGPLLRAIAALGRSDTHLLVVGRVSVGAYAREIAQLGMSGRVRFTGPTSTVAQFYGASDVFALPTQYEAWGLVIVEAMACGLPVLTSRLAGAAIAVREGHTGLLLDDPGDTSEISAKLSRILAGECAPSHQISLHVEPYRWVNILQKYEQILTSNPL